ncbi:MAG: hydrogenase maturation protease [Acidimicrobiia bacterium]
MDPLIIGIGNRVRGDDAAGLKVVELLGLSDTVLEHDGEPASLIALWEGHDEVVLIDAVTSGGKPGSVIEIDASTSILPAGMCNSTHALGPAEAVELARALGKLPAKATLLGIEGRDYSFGAGMSKEVEAAVTAVVKRLRPA